MLRRVGMLALVIFGWLRQGIASGEELHHQGLVGETMTQDQIFISHQMGGEIVNIYIYGWGSLWPFADEGQKGESDDGGSIDRRIAMAAKDGQQVMLTCATAPSNYRESNKPWDMEERVMDGMEDLYAKRCAATVQRWPAITRVQVWNELKGYWLSSPEQRWNYEAYTRFYDKVYRAVKAVKSEVMVGGGYVALGEGRGHDRMYDGVMIDYRAMDALQYWLKHAVAYDAVCLDSSRSPDEFIRITHYVRGLSPGKPIWWSEVYSSSPAQMRAARDTIARDQHRGDVELWWASEVNMWGDEPN